MPDTLTITDNRTGKQYEIPIEQGAIKAMDLRQIRVSPDDFGMMTYDPDYYRSPPEWYQPILDRRNAAMKVDHAEWFIDIVNGEVLFERFDRGDKSGKPVCFGYFDLGSSNFVSYWPVHAGHDPAKHDIRPSFVIFSDAGLRKYPKWEVSLSEADHIDPASSKDAK